MSDELMVGLMVAGLALFVIVLSLYFFQVNLRKRALNPAAQLATAQTAASAPAQTSSPAPSSQPVLQFTRLRSVEQALYRLALNLPATQNLDAQEHIVKAVTNSIDAALTGQKYLPRRPLLIPQLMRALNDEDSTRKDLSKIILQDPVLSGDVLNRANSSYYRVWQVPVETIDRALMLLGVEGLKSVVATSVMRPVFNTPPGIAPDFSTLIWEQALRSAEAAGLYADKTGNGDRFSAHLLGLLSALGKIALFRLTLDIYAEQQLPPIPATIVKILDEQSLATSQRIAAHWNLAENFLNAMEEQLDETVREQFSPLGKALYYGRLCGTLALLREHSGTNDEQVRATTEQLGLEEKIFDALWDALRRPD